MNSDPPFFEKGDFWVLKTREEEINKRKVVHKRNEGPLGSEIREQRLSATKKS